MLFPGVYACTFQPGNLTGWGREALIMSSPNVSDTSRTLSVSLWGCVCVCVRVRVLVCVLCACVGVCVYVCACSEDGYAAVTPRSHPDWPWSIFSRPHATKDRKRISRYRLRKRRLRPIWRRRPCVTSLMAVSTSLCWMEEMIWYMHLRRRNKSSERSNVLKDRMLTAAVDSLSEWPTNGRNDLMHAPEKEKQDQWKIQCFKGLNTDWLP